MNRDRLFLVILVIVFALIWAVTGCDNREVHQIENGDLIIEIDSKLNTRLQSKTKLSSLLNPSFQNSEFIVVSGEEFNGFTISSSSEQIIEDKIGKGLRHSFIGKSQNVNMAIEKHLTITQYDLFSDLFVFSVKYINKSDQPIEIEKWTNNQYTLAILDKDESFWSFQGSSTSARADWILPVSDGFYQRNYMGMNNSDYGGGIPVTDIWRSDAGIAIGHLSMHPELVSLPVDAKYKKDKVSIGVEKNIGHGFELGPDETLETLETFVLLHIGDCYNSLNQFGQMMRAKGMQFAEREEAAFEPIWCAWGYEREFTLDEIVGTLPKVKELGFKWAVLDDGFQIAEGDWNVNRNKFPGGDKQMKKLVDKIHSYGLKAKLWWAPLAVDPCSNLLEENPDIILYTDEWAPQFITWWDAYYMAPTYDKTIEHTKGVLELFIDDWGFDGLKMDGQHMNAVGPDHHPRHGLEYPEESIEKLPEFFEMIYETTMVKNPNAVVENCPCGTCMSFYNMPYMNQAVSSDPLSSWQIRLKGKVYKALIPETAYYGDHVELSDNASDFASSFGIGAVLGSKFTWPKDNPLAEGTYLLTPEKEEIWKKWISLYNEKMLSKEDYLGAMYDIGFDKPETHVIEKDGVIYYAFYDKDWKGKIELRGLEKGKDFVAFDYVKNIEVAKFNGDNPTIEVEFQNNLLIEVSPVNGLD